MMVVWSRAAVTDLAELRQWIARERPEAAGRVAADILAAVDQIRRFPASGRLGRLAGTRERVVTGAPYTIAYRVGATSVQVIRVLHQRRDWQTTTE